MPDGSVDAETEFHEEKKQEDSYFMAGDNVRCKSNFFIVIIRNLFFYKMKKVTRPQNTKEEKKRHKLI